MEDIRDWFPKNSLVPCPPSDHIVVDHSCYDKPGGASTRFCIVPNSDKDDFEMWLLRSFQLPPRFHYGDVDSAWKVFARKDRMEYALHTLDVPICQHIKLNMPEVAAMVDSGCFFSQPVQKESQKPCPEISCKCIIPNEVHVELNRLFTPGTGLWKHYQKCSACELQGVETALALRALVQTRDVQKQEFIVWTEIEVRVNLGTLGDSKDPAWVLHTFEQAELEGTFDAYSRWLDGFHNEVKSMHCRLRYPSGDHRSRQLKEDRSKAAEAPVQQKNDQSKAPEAPCQPDACLAM